IYGKKYYKNLLAELNLNGTESVLDFGSGTGVLAKKIIVKLSNGGTLTCLDLSESFLNKVRKKLRKYANVDYILGDIQEMNIPSNSFDKIVITWVIHHIEDVVRFGLLQSIVNTLKPNGEIYVVEFLGLPHGISDLALIELFNRIGLSGRMLRRKKNTGIFEFKRN
ncbi:MAG: class I SAM-dependent methyltransferase, partial [Promethearchaeota archaeon]